MNIFSHLLQAITAEYERRIRAASQIKTYGAAHHAEATHAPHTDHIDHTDATDEHGDDGDVGETNIANVVPGTRFR